MWKITAKDKGFLRKLRSIKPKHVVWMFIVLYTIFFSWYTILKHHAFLTSAFDLGIFDQALWSTLHGKFLYTTLYGEEASITFAHHFQPILLLILPIYTVYQSPETLLVLQSFFLALGALPIYWIAKKELNEFAGLVFSALFLLYPALHGINRFDFHAAVLAVPFFFFSFHYAKENRYLQSGLSALIVLMCREEAALTIVVLALYLLWSNRKKIFCECGIKRRELIFPLLLIVVSSLWFILSVFFISPFFIKSGVYPHFARYKYPLADLFVDLDKKLFFISLLLAPLLFIPLLNPSTLMITLPTFAIVMLTGYSPTFQIGFQYPYAAIPFIFISAVYGVKRLRLTKRMLRKLLVFLMILGIAFTLLISPTPLGVMTKGVPGVAINEELPKIMLHQRALEEIIKLIPPDASLSTQNDIFPHVSHRFNVHLLYNKNDEYVLIDTTSLTIGTGGFELTYEEAMEIVRDYGLVATADDIYLYKKVYKEDPIDLAIKNGLRVEFYNNPELSGEPTFETVLFRIYHDWILESPYFLINKDCFSATFEGFLYVPTSGIYTFKMRSDDGSKLYIDDHLILNGWGNQSFTANVTINLENGFHKIKSEYVEYGGYAAIWLYWRTPDSNQYQPIPEDSYYLEPSK